MPCAIEKLGILSNLRYILHNRLRTLLLDIMRNPIRTIHQQRNMDMDRDRDMDSDISLHADEEALLQLQYVASIYFGHTVALANWVFMHILNMSRSTFITWVPCALDVIGGCDGDGDGDGVVLPGVSPQPFAGGALCQVLKSC